MTVNVMPKRPLKILIMRKKFPKLSPYQTGCYLPQCGLALKSLRILKYNFDCDLMTPDEIPDLITFLIENGYQIETQITNMLNQSEIKVSDKKTVFTVTYYDNNQPNITYINYVTCTCIIS